MAHITWPKTPAEPPEPRRLIAAFPRRTSAPCLLCPSHTSIIHTRYETSPFLVPVRHCSITHSECLKIASWHHSTLFILSTSPSPPLLLPTVSPLITLYQPPFSLPVSLQQPHSIKAFLQFPFKHPASMGNAYSQAFPPRAKLTEKECPDQTGKVACQLHPKLHTSC